MFFKKNGKKFRECPDCGLFISSKSKKCKGCGVEFSDDKSVSDTKVSKFLNINEMIRKKTRHWREAIMIFAAIKLPIEIIAFFELDSFIGKLQGLGDLIFAFLLLIVSSWMVAMKFIRKRRGEFVE